MTLKSVLVDGYTDRPAAITREGALITTLSGALPIDGKVTSLPFATFVSVNGATNLNLNGSLSSPIQAKIDSSPLGDIYITTLDIVVADNGAVALNKFGSQPALINGVQIFYEVPEVGTVIGLSVKTNFDFIRLGNLTTGIGGKADAYQIANLDTSNNDGYNPVLDMTRLSPLGLGIRIRKNSNEAAGVRIRDNLTGVSTFTVLATGYIRLIPD